MSQYRITYLHRDRELTKDVVAFSEAEARQIFRHNFRNIAPVSVERIEHPPERKVAPSPRRAPYRRRGTEGEFKSVAEGLRSFRERLAASSVHPENPVHPV